MSPVIFPVRPYQTLESLQGARYKLLFSPNGDIVIRHKCNPVVSRHQDFPVAAGYRNQRIKLTEIGSFKNLMLSLII
jgi:hypothetical protein